MKPGQSADVLYAEVMFTGLRFPVHSIGVALLFFYIFSGPLAGVEYTNVKADSITYSSARIGWTTDTASISVIRYGLSPSALSEIQEEMTPVRVTRHRYFLSGLKANTEYTYQVCESTTQCSPGRYQFRTAARPDNWPAAAQRPRQVADPQLFSVASLPAIDGETFTVSLDCRDLGAKIRAAAAADGNKNHQVLIPAEADCTAPSDKIIGDANGPTLHLPAKNGANPNGTGEIIIRSAAPNEVLPPEGVRTGPSFLSKMPTIRNGEFGVRELFNPASVGNVCTPGQWWWHFNQPGWSLKQCSEASSNTYTLVPRQDFTGDPPSNCKPSSWYFKTDEPANVNGVYWCTPGGKIYNMALGRTVAFQFSEKAHHYRLFGIHFSLVPLGEHAWKSTAVYNDGSLYQGMFDIPASAHHITFDRCVFAGMEAPERLFNMFYSGGSYIAWVNNHIEKVSHWLPHSEAGDFEATAIQLTGGNFLKIVNNYVESTGITIFASDDADRTTTDVEMTGNVIRRPERYRFGTTANSRELNGLFYQSRHLLELKRGVRWLVDGNRFEGNFATVNQGHILALSPRPGPNPDPLPETAMTDIAITNNWFGNTPNGIYLIGHNDLGTTQMPTTSRIELFNNLLVNIDGTLVAKGTPNRSGQCFTVLLGVEDVSVRNNICYDNAGYWPAFLWEQHGPSAGLDFQNNVVSLKMGDGFGGLVSPGATRGTKSLEKGFPGGYRFTNNAIINVAGDSLRDYPAGNFWLRSAWDMGWVDHTNGNFRLKLDSVFRAGHPAVENEFGPGNDNSDMGVRFDLFDRAQRAVGQVDVEAGGVEATLRFSPAGTPTSCAADVSTDASFRESSRFGEDTPTEESRSVRLTGLQPGTTYYWRLLCGAQSEGSFTTLSGPGGL